MLIVNIFGWRAVEKWCPTMFLGTGGLWLGAGIVNEVHRQQLLDEFAGIHLGDIAFPVILVAMIGTFGALLGLYPRLAERSPRVALAGIVVGAVPAVGNAIFLLVVAAVFTLPPSRAILETAGVSEGLRLILVVGFVLYPVGSALFGVESLRTDTLSQPVGYLLLVPIILWIVVLGTLVLEQLVTEQNLTGGISTMIDIGMAASSLSIGYLLYTGAVQPTRTEQSVS